MTLRESLGGDVRRIHELVDALLDREDGILALFDGVRVISFTHGFGVSASQLELLSVELERALRNVVGRPAKRPKRRSEPDRKRPVDGVLRLASKVA
jgi:hypothetical protein